MKTANPLIDVNFIDNSNYVQPLETDDIVGVVAETVWGKADEFQILDQVGWKAIANPNNLGRINQSYATINRLFEAGAKYIELYRLGAGLLGEHPEKILCFSVLADSITTNAVPCTKDLEWLDEVVGNNPLIAFRYRYPGGFPGKVEITTFEGPKPAGLSATLYSMNFYLYANAVVENGTVKDWGAPVESFKFTAVRAIVSGESLFYADVLRSKSQFFTADLDYEVSADPGAINSSVDFSDLYSGEGSMVREAIDDNSVGITFTEEEYSVAYGKFKDRDLSQATLLVSTFDPNFDGKQSEIETAVKGVASKRMDLIGLFGCPKSCFSNIDDDSNVEAIVKYFNNTLDSAGWDKFLGAIAAVERYIVGNKVFYLDGTASWAGAICNVAANLQNRNQLASYKAYGSTSAVLVKTLGFESVVELMENYGIGSIYKSSVGNYIFNIRSRYELQSSYFGKLNVMRVTAAVLHWLLTDVEYVIHTAVVSDEGDRLAFQERCNKKLSQMIARGELKSESVISCGNAINTDELTNGGECLNIEAYLWYKKLAERVKISIIATDTTTSVEVTQG